MPQHKFVVAVSSKQRNHFIFDFIRKLFARKSVWFLVEESKKNYYAACTISEPALKCVCDCNF